VAVLVGYELELSRFLKNGSDIWLNNPVGTREASGMTAEWSQIVLKSMNDVVSFFDTCRMVNEYYKNIYS
jgi:glucan phosphorylase